MKEGPSWVRSKRFCVARRAASDMEKPGDEVQKSPLEHRTANGLLVGEGPTCCL